MLVNAQKTAIVTKNTERAYTLAKILHENWCSAHIDDAGDVEIAVPFEKLSPYWQAENIKAAEFVLNELCQISGEYTSEVVESISAKVHDRWLERNEWADDNPRLDIPYADLTENEKSKDREQVLAGIALLQGKIALLPRPKTVTSNTHAKLAVA